MKSLLTLFLALLQMNAWAQEAELPYQESAAERAHVMKVRFPGQPVKNYQFLRIFNGEVIAYTYNYKLMNGLHYRVVEFRLTELMMKANTLQDIAEEGIARLTDDADFNNLSTFEPIQVTEGTPYTAWKVDYRPYGRPARIITAYLIEDKLYLAEAEYAHNDPTYAKMFTDAFQITW
jgi:hypothetical protein